MQSYIRGIDPNGIARPGTVIPAPRTVLNSTGVGLTARTSSAVCLCGTLQQITHKTEPASITCTQTERDNRVQKKILHTCGAGMTMPGTTPGTQKQHSKISIISSQLPLYLRVCPVRHQAQHFISNLIAAAAACVVLWWSDRPRGTAVTTTTIIIIPLLLLLALPGDQPGIQIHQIIITEVLLLFTA